MGKSLKSLSRKALYVLQDEGFKPFLIRSKNFVTYRVKNRGRVEDSFYKDILFINGCDLPHPQRYRVDHQMEQLEAFGMTCDKAFYADLTLDQLKYYRGFVFYRCPILPVIEEFIKQAKAQNKTTFYDIDDLVFDTKYTDQIKYLDEMSKSERELYDDGVNRMGKTLKLCEYGIASTKRLQTEMAKSLKDVFINRNVASERMVKYSLAALREKRQDDKIIMGYFSGSITHNDDFKLIMPTIVKLLEKYDNLYLKIVGLLDLPPEMEKVKDKVLVAPFTDWKKLPNLIHSVDINLAPLEDTIFNEAKSENKWTEASLVKVPTVASNVGAFKEIIKNNQTGILCKDAAEWEKALTSLIEKPELRTKIANQAYDEVIKKHVTTYSGQGVVDFIASKLRKNFIFVLPSTNVSGGILVALRHASILKKHGYDVTLASTMRDKENIIHENEQLNVIPFSNLNVTGHVDTMVATMWSTLSCVASFYNCDHRKYLVQNFETDFYEYTKPERALANTTYSRIPGIDYITISKWCEKWLTEDFHNQVKFAPNGIDLSMFPSKKRTFKKDQKVKILIEGDSKSYYKNVDESFKITDQLDREKFEVHYLSYNGKPKRNYRYDKFYQNIPHSEVWKIYQNCDVLLKTSILESFSYPPLEMMATGGFCVVRPNDGNIEYLKDGENCLFYKPGDIDDAVAKINQIVSDSSLRDKLAKGSQKTVASRDWLKIENDIVKLYT